MKVYAVQFSNYEPAEIDSLWERKEDAEARAAERNAGRDWEAWDVVAWQVHPASTDAPDGEGKA